MTRVKEAPGVARLRADEGRARAPRGSHVLKPPVDPFLSAAQEQQLFVDLKRQGKVRAKAGYNDVRPFVEAYKTAVRSRLSA